MNTKKDTKTKPRKRTPVTKRDFDVNLAEIKVTVGGEKYTIKELTGSDNDQEMNAMKDRMKFDENGKPCGYNNMAGIKSGLLARCLYDEGGKLVPETVIITWPNRVVSDLHQLAQEVSGLALTDEELEEAAKND